MVVVPTVPLPPRGSAAVTVRPLEDDRAVHASAPPSTIVAPVNVLTPASVSVPVPILTSDVRWHAVAGEHAGDNGR